MNVPRSHHKSAVMVLLQPLGGAIGAVIALGVLALATRQGQFTSIASFGAGSGVAALASVVVGGGTTLAYTTGTGERQHAVRVVRNVVVLPVILIATVVAVLLYGIVGPLDPLDVAAGGISTCAAVGAELDSSYLRRHLKSGQLFVADILNRMAAFGVILLGAPFALAMLAGALSRALLLRGLTAADPSREAGFRINRSVLELAYEGKLTTLSVLYSVCDRVGALTAPATAPAAVAGGFMAVLSAQQNASGVLMSGLQATLAARSQLRSRLVWANRLDVLFVVAGFAGAALMIAWRGPLTKFLGLEITSGSGDYWTAVALLIPTTIASRVFDFRFLAQGAVRRAVISRASATSVALFAAVTALLSSQIVVLANGLLIAEGTAVLASSGLLLLEYLRTRREHHHA